MNPDDFQVAWEVMKWPLAACLILPPLLVYLGLHVVRRGIIFIDIAMAQMASLGVCFAVMKHLDPGGPVTFWISLGFTIFAAGRLPHAEMRVATQRDVFADIQWKCGLLALRDDGHSHSKRSAASRCSA